jgi:methylenetetrahydrofolate dehydrogenase (NADP+)/methenyltetrahydrofolate cyclohydrolase
LNIGRGNLTSLINGNKIAQNLRNELKEEIDDLKIKTGKVPGLAVVQVGNVAASSVYVKAKTKSAKEVGIEVFDHHLPEETTEEELLKIVNTLNNQDNVNGILVQLPLPKNINEQLVLDSIHPEKDADGFHPLNVGKLSIASHNDENLLIPCTPYGCLIMLKGLRVDLSGKNALVIGRSNIVGKPMAQLLLKESCTVTIAHSRTKNIEEVCKKADIVIAAVGRPKMVKGDWIKKEAVVIDVGINRIKSEIEGEIKNKLVGDVDFDEASKNASAITPVPGGVGPMTIACLLRNTTIAFKNRNQ